jgi:uncharacterized membrane protein YczE
MNNKNLLLRVAICIPLQLGIAVNLLFIYLYIDNFTNCTQQPNLLFSRLIPNITNP